MQHQDGDWVSLLIKTGLKENVGMQSTFSRIKLEDK